MKQIMKPIFHPPAGRDNPGGHLPCAVRSRADGHLRQHRFFGMSAELHGARASQRPGNSEIDPVATFQCVARGGAHPVRAPGRRGEKYLALRRARTALSRAHPLDPERLQEANSGKRGVRRGLRASSPPRLGRGRRSLTAGLRASTPLAHIDEAPCDRRRRRHGGRHEVRAAAVALAALEIAVRGRGAALARARACPGSWRGTSSSRARAIRSRRRGRSCRGPRPRPAP